MLFFLHNRHQKGSPIRKGYAVPDGITPIGKFCKRSFDCVASAAMILICSPLYVICFAAIKCEDGGPAFFRQERIGLGGKPFYIYKFRSMRCDAETNGPELFKGNDDKRLTKVGKFLRDRHLDELPQLLNVLTGDMAFVGHRPERAFFIEQIMKHDPRYESLYQCRPGVTSIATLRNGYTDTMEKMLRRLKYDLFYLRHRSWLWDLRILADTFFKIIGARKF